MHLKIILLEFLLNLPATNELSGILLILTSVAPYYIMDDGDKENMWTNIGHTHLSIRWVWCALQLHQGKTLSRVDYMIMGSHKQHNFFVKLVFCNFLDTTPSHAVDKLSYPWFNSLWPNDAILRHRSGSTLAQVMACCLTAPSHYLNQCWLIISKVLYHSSEDLIKKNQIPISKAWILQAWILNFWSCIQIPRAMN